MNAKEFRLIAKAMKEFGVTQFKCKDFEIALGGELKPAPIHRKRLKKLKVDKDALEEGAPIPHVVTELSSLMKMGDEELANRLFPDHTQDEEIA